MIEWKQLHIDSYGYIEVSSEGVIKNKKGKILFKRIDKNGYERVRVHYKRSDNRNKCIDMFVHRLVAQCFIKTDKNIKELQVNHKDGNKKNNHYLNLEWVTNKGNIEHAIKTGLSKVKGEDNSNSKLSKEDVESIRHIWKTKNISRADLARMFNISWTMVNNIVKYRNWI